jgi:NADPH:quinone reductase
MERAKKFISDGLSAKLFWAKIDRVFDGLDEYAAAHRYLETNDQIGKITVALSN